MSFGAPAIGFDRVEVTERDGTVRSLSPGDFVEIGLGMRVRYILEKRLRFFRGSQDVPMKEALASLQ